MFAVRDNGRVVVFEEFEAKTGGRLDALDVTDDVAKVVSESGVSRGTALVFAPHTTCCVLIAVPGAQTEAALRRAMEALAPSDAYYAHDDLNIRTENLIEGEPPNAPAHILHVFAGRVSESIPINDGRMVIGDDQRVLLVELDASRKRRYCVQVVGE
jgi:secondary thiamine-phosphate synthase enzyme